MTKLIDARVTGLDQTSLSAGLIEAYLRTEYQIPDSPVGGLVIRPGEVCMPLNGLMAALNVETAAFITAYNPLGELMTAELNDGRYRQLLDAIGLGGWEHYAGEGIGDDGSWEPEQSVLILGASSKAARELGDRFGQNAIVFVQAHLPAKLVLLR